MQTRFISIPLALLLALPAVAATSATRPITKAAPTVIEAIRLERSDCVLIYPADNGEVFLICTDVRSLQPRGERVLPALIGVGEDPMENVEPNAYSSSREARPLP